MKDPFVLNHDIKVCERKLDSANNRIAKIKKQKSPIRNLKLILPFVISLFFLIFPRLAGDYCHKTIVEANARGIHNVDLGIFNNSYIRWFAHFGKTVRLYRFTEMCTDMKQCIGEGSWGDTHELPPIRTYKE